MEKVLGWVLNVRENIEDRTKETIIYLIFLTLLTYLYTLLFCTVRYITWIYTM